MTVVLRVQKRFANNISMFRDSEKKIDDCVKKSRIKTNIRGFCRHKYSTNQNFRKHSHDDFSTFPLARVSRIFAEDGAVNRGSCGKNNFLRQNHDTRFAKNSDDVLCVISFSTCR